MTAKLYPWQLDMLDKMNGIKPGQIMTMTSGRNTGKSHFTAAAIKRLMDDLNNRPVEDLILSEGTVYGARYHCVQPVGGNWPEMEAWCRQTFSNPGDKLWGEPKAPEPAQRWYMNNRKFWFREEKDRTMFILKWR